MPSPRATASRPAIVLTLVVAMLATLGPAVPGLAAEEAGSTEQSPAADDEHGPESTELPGYTPPPKPDRIELTPGDSPTDFTVKFAEGTDVRLRQGRFASRAGAGAGEVNRILHARPRVGVERVLRASEAAVTQQRRRAEQRSGRPQADLNLLYSFSADAADAEELMNELNALDVVEYVAPDPAAVSVPAMPGGAVLAQAGTSSGDFTDKQTYRQAAPNGIGSVAAHAEPGGTGENVKVFDLEWDWRQSHEDLGSINGRLLANGTPAGQTQSMRNHGTGVMGVLVGDANSIGVTGVVPDAAPRMVNVQNTERGFDIVNAVVRAIADSSPGDVLLIEAQVAGPNSTSSQTRWAPIEWYEPAFTAISIAVSHGLTVIVPAGNGLEGGNEGEDLDGPSYAGRFDRSVRDSGAIFVGAGSVQGCNQWSPTQRLRRLPYSNYGSRVDVQAAGECVATTGGWAPSRILQGPPAYPENRWYTEGFSGTSSAAAIIAGAAASVSSIAQQRDIDPLTSPEVRALIQRGASEQLGSAAQRQLHIGPQPDLAKAILVLDHMQVCTEGGDDWEPNGTIFEATPLRLSQEVAGVVCAGERDHFAVQLTADQEPTVEVTFTADLGVLDWRLLDEDGVPVLGNQPAADGTYYLEISGDDEFVVNAYTLEVDQEICSPPPDQPVDGSLAEGTTVEGIVCAGTTDSYSIDLVSDRDVLLELTWMSSPGALEVDLVDPWGQIVEPEPGNGSQQVITPRISGRHIIEVSVVPPHTESRYVLEVTGQATLWSCDGYASALGHDGAPGTFEDPVFSLAALVDLLKDKPETVGCLKDDGVFHYAPETGTISDGGTTPAAPFRIRSAPDHDAKIQGPVWVGASNVVLEHLEFIGWPSASAGEPLLRITPQENQVLSGVAFQHNTVAHSRGSCLEVTGAEQVSVVGNRIHDCHIGDAVDGDQGDGDDGDADGIDPGDDGDGTDDGEGDGTDGDGTDDGDGDGTDAGDDGDGTDGDGTDDGDGDGTDGDGTDDGDGDGGTPDAHGVHLVEVTHAQVMHNLVYSNADGGLQIGPPADDVLVAHNVFDRNGTNVAFGYATETVHTENAVVRQNIITNGTTDEVFGEFPSDHDTETGNRVEDNCIYPGEVGGHGYEEGEHKLKDPDYSAPTYQLPVDSPCVGRGPASIQPAAPVPPTAPQDLKASPGNGGIDLSWSQPASPGTHARTGYTVRLLPRDPQEHPDKNLAPDATAATFTNLANGTSYDVAVRAETDSAAGPGPWAVVGDVTPRTKPGAPASVTVKARNGAIDVTWQPPASTGGVPLTDYRITVSGNGQGETVPAAVRYLRVTGLTNGQPYTVSVRAINEAGEGPPRESHSVTPRTTPTAPRNVAASAGDRQLTVTWSPPESDGGNAVKEYTVTVGGQSKTVAAGQPRTATFTGLTNGTTYTAQVWAENDAGPGPTAAVQATPTAPDSGTPPPGATEPGLPRTVRATPADRAIGVTWRQPLSDGGSPITQYLITATPVADLAAGAEARTISVPGDARGATVPELLNGVAYEVRVAARNAVGTGGAQSAPSPITPGLSASGVHRIAGANRFATAAEISRATFPNGAPVAYVATGTNYPDALAGGAAAARAGGPVLLVAPDVLPPETAEELARVAPDQIIVLGGASAVSAGVEAQLAELAPVVRMAGDNRFATAAEISHATFPDGAPVAFVATGTNYPDALAGGAAAAEAGGPVLLVAPELLPTATADELTRLAPERIYVLGGASAVPEDIAAELGAIAPVTRLAGPNRFATADQIAAEVFPGTVPVTYVATGENFPDALAGSAAAGFSGGPVLLVNQALVPLDTETALDRLQPPAIYVLGGENAVSAEVFTTLEAR